MKNITEYKKSLFTLEIPVIDGILLYNTLSCQLVLLKYDEILYWGSDLSSFDDDILSDLISKHFLVESNTDESRELFNKINTYNKKNTHFKILTTTHCNANCPYCFETDFPRMHMTMNTAVAVSSFINLHTTDSPTISVGWFGGEPLLNTDVIDYLTKKITAENPTKKYSASIVTNGSLIDNSLASKFNEWKIRTAQITFDGVGQYYDSIKMYNSPKHTFDEVIQNIHSLIDNKCRVTIRFNYSADNVLECLKGIDFIYNEFKRNVSVYCSPIFPGDEKTRQNLEQLELILFSKLSDYGYITKKSLLKRKEMSCGLGNYSNYYVIGPDGSVYKCCELMLYPEISKIGTIFDKNLNVDIINKWIQKKVPDECYLCPYLPLCMGGCKAKLFGHPFGECFRYKSIIEKAIVDIYYSMKYNNQSIEHKTQQYG